MHPSLDLDLLRSFVAIAETGSFTAAARRVNRTQSAVSMQIKRLEGLLGRELFGREGRSVQLSVHGEVLLDHARRILRAHQDALAAFNGQLLTGEVTLSSPDDYASMLLPPILARFAETHPRVQVNVLCEPSVALIERLQAGSCDLALVTAGSGERDGILIHEEPIVWVTSARHAAHLQNPLPLAVFHAGCCFRRRALEQLAAIGRPSRIAYTSLSIAGIYAALEAGLAVGALLKSNVRPGLRMLLESEGFPPLGKVGVALVRSPMARGELIDRLEQHVLDALRAVGPLPLAA